ncbi:feruloyl esterase-like protein [Trametes gibbosa]|nr:feruloyl esterase-like protein [Trametes gibbosa]
MSLSITLALLGLAISATATSGSPSACASFKFAPHPLAHIALAGATHYTANTHVNISNVYSSIDVSDLPSFCRIELVITTNATAGSSALAEVWLPDAWNGRVLTVGNGGLAGGVTVTELGHVAMPQGFAGISTNTGHDGDTDEGEWAGPHNDNAIVDWGWRALHLSVLAGKSVVEQYYGKPANKSYYLGCSTGKWAPGFVRVCRLKEVQDFPEDFDGVVVGSPANWQTHLQGWSIHMNLNTQPSTSPHFITEDVWNDVLAPEVMRQCDGIDGLSDGIINDPRKCSFRPETLTCRLGQNTSTCLTADQISALQRIYADYYEADQTYVFGGYYPGGETEYYKGLVGQKQFAIGVGYFQFMVLNDTNFDIRDYNATILEITDRIDPGQSNAINPNLTAFAGPSHNGKLLQYVGWADQLISPGNSLHYYETVHQFTLANTTMDIDDYYRLFLVPGMNHCNCLQGGFAANAFGSVEQASNNNPPLSFEPQHNILAAMVRWVEEGIAPDTLTAANYVGNNATNGVGFTRPLCRYPSTIRYHGGDPNSADSFHCE